MEDDWDIDKAIDKVIGEYGDVLRALGSENPSFDSDGNLIPEY